MPASKYIWTSERDEQLRAIYRKTHGKEKLTERLKLLAEEFGWPRHVLTLRAQRIGIARDVRKPWTDADIRFLEESAGKLSARQIAKRLGRTYISVASKISHNYFREEGDLTAYDVLYIFGVSWYRVKEWRDLGWLCPSRGDWYTRHDLAVFMLTHPEAFDPRTVEIDFLRSVLREAGKRLGLKAGTQLRKAA